MAYFPNFSETARLGFQTGVQLGEGQNPLGTFVRSMLADWQQRRSLQAEYGMKLSLVKEEAKAKTEAEKATIQEIIGKGQTQGGFQPTKFTYGGITFENPQMVIEQQKQEELAKGIPPAQAGLDTLAEESIKNIGDIKKTLFPSGTTESFRRKTAGKSNIPMSWLPLMPQVAPFSEDAQNIYRKMGVALSGRQLIQTGVAARPEETQRLIQQFAPNLFSNPKSALKGLNELEDFYKNYRQTLRTKGISTQSQSKQYIRTGTDSITGKRVGMLSNGSIEEIQ